MSDLRVVLLPARRGVARFVSAGSTLHERARASGAAHPGWVPTLPALQKHVLAPSHPFWGRADRALFLARRGSRIVGRVAAIENRAHNDAHGDRVGFFGFFDVADDPAAAVALVDAARGWLAQRGLERIRGPVSPSMNYESGCLVEGFDQPNVFLTPWNPPWYGSYLEEKAGLGDAQTLVATWCPADHELPGPVRRAVDRARKEGALTFRDGRAEDYGRDAETLRTLYNEAWDGTWGFVPFGRDEFAGLAAAARHLLLERFGFFAERGGETVGFTLVVPDYNRVLAGPAWRRWIPVALGRMLLARPRVSAGRVMLLGVREGYRGSRLLPLFIDELLRRAREHGLEGAEASWMIEDGLMHRAMEGVGMRVTKRWRIYEGEV